MLTKTLYILICLVFLGFSAPAYSQERQDYFDDPVAEEPSIGFSERAATPATDPSKRRSLPVGFSYELIGSSEAGVSTATVNTTLPLLFLGSPPPLVRFGVGFTELSGVAFDEFPENFFDYSASLSWIRPINDRWTIRTMLGIGFATDNENNSSDAWQFRGGIFGMYRTNEALTWTFGALATGRDDLPVIPAIGAIWMPHSAVRYDFTFPKPRINLLMAEVDDRHHWAYFGFGINGNTWAYQTNTLEDDRLTYKDLRVVLGWEIRPAASAGSPFAFGNTFQAEIGYVFSRELEFMDETVVRALDDAIMFGVTARF